MNVVGIRVDNDRLFESQSISNDEQKQSAIDAILQDAVAAGIEIEIVEMSSEELESILSQ